MVERHQHRGGVRRAAAKAAAHRDAFAQRDVGAEGAATRRRQRMGRPDREVVGSGHPSRTGDRSEEHTSELQSLMRISYAVYCLKNKLYTNPIVRSHAYQPCMTLYCYFYSTF